MIEFLQDNWRLLVECLLVVISFVFCVFRKKPIKIVDTLKQLFTQWLPSVISMAENTQFKGEDKLNYCINALYEVFAKDYISYSEYLEKYYKYLVSQIEAILSTPKKKG